MGLGKRKYGATSSTTTRKRMRKAAVAKKRTGKTAARRRPRPAVRTMVRSMVRNQNAVRYLPCATINEKAPTAIQNLAKAYHFGGFLGATQPSNWSGTWNSMLGVQLQQGTGELTRQGTQVYMRNTVIQIQIDMNNIADNAAGIHPIHEFRLIVFKSKMKYLAGGTADPSRSLLLNSQNEPVGHATPLINLDGTDLILNKTNKRNFTIYRDQYFRMSNPQIAVDSGVQNSHVSGFSSHYPSMKRFRLYMPHNKKCHYDEGTDLPTNYNPAYAYVIYARSLGKDQYANSWEVNTRGCTQWSDI